MLGLFATLYTSAATDSWVVRQDGIGPANIGMSLTQLNTTLHEKFSMPENKEDQGCFYVNPAKHPQLSFMIEDGRLVRVDVDKAGVSTVEGVQVGDSEERTMQVYGARVKVEENAYAPEERYLTVRSDDGRYGTRFETEKGKIRMFYAGRYEAIQYIEGCQ